MLHNAVVLPCWIMRFLATITASICYITTRLSSHVRYYAGQPHGSLYIHCINHYHNYRHWTVTRQSVCSVIFVQTTQLRLLFDSDTPHQMATTAQYTLVVKWVPHVLKSIKIQLFILTFSEISYLNFKLKWLFIHGKRKKDKQHIVACMILLIHFIFIAIYWFDPYFQINHNSIITSFNP